MPPSIYLITKPKYGCFGWPVDPRDIHAYRYSLAEAQEEHKNMCIAAADCKAFDIRGPYDDETEIEAFHMLQSGMQMLTAEEFKKQLDQLGYKIKKEHTFNYQNTANERHYKAVAMYYTEKISGLSFANIGARRDENFKRLQEIRRSCFVWHQGRIWDL